MSSKKYGSKFLKGFRQYRVDRGVEALVIKKFLQSLDCPRALTVWLLYESGEHGQLVDLEFSPLDYNSFSSIRDSYAATKFLSKFKGLTLDRDLDEVALTKFMKFELRCKSTNSRFRNLAADPLYKGQLVWLHHAVTRKIANILGEFNVEEFLSSPDWGPGASTLIKRRDASPAKKFQCETGITRDLYSLFPTDLIKKIYPLWGAHLEDCQFPFFQVGNKVVTVPKDASTNRVIAIEPGINLWFQLSLGNMIERRLLRCGIDLHDQGRNQYLAKIGSKDQSLATIDLSSASDSISLEVVRDLFPPVWFQVLDSCRSHYGQLNNSLVKWEKFSSMGNGFTFPIESLIFYAVAVCCAEIVAGGSTVSVYGDDIIIPISCVKLFSAAMEFYGFQFNEKKSHFNSTFRESCGSHWSSGIDIKPIYLKDRLSSVLSVYRLANAIRRLSHRRNCYFGCDKAFRVVFDLLVRKVPKAFRFRIPEGFGDGGFISNFDEATPSYSTRDSEWLQHSTFSLRAVSEVSVSHQDDNLGYLLAELWRMPSRPVVNDCAGWLMPIQIPGSSRDLNRPSRLKAIADLTASCSERQGRNSVPSHDTKLKISRSLVQQWYNLGPWI